MAPSSPAPYRYYYGEGEGPVLDRHRRRTKQQLRFSSLLLDNSAVDYRAATYSTSSHDGHWRYSRSFGRLMGVDAGGVHGLGKRMWGWCELIESNRNLASNPMSGPARTPGHRVRCQVSRASFDMAGKPKLGIETWNLPSKFLPGATA